MKKRRTTTNNRGFSKYLVSILLFEAATIPYAVAKIFGPLLFGRGWCGYACWTAMVLDFLPYKQPQSPRKERHPLRQMPAGLPHERGGQQGIPQTEKRNGMHPLLRVYKGLPNELSAERIAESAQELDFLADWFGTFI